MKPAHTRVLINGYFGPNQGVETWQIGLNLAGNPFPTNAAKGVAALGALNAYATHLLEDWHTPFVKLLYARVEAIDIDGRVVRNNDGSLQRGDSVPGAPIAGGVTEFGAYEFPPQLAVAISLKTARQGATGKGRFYIPMVARALAPDGRLATATVEFLAPAAAEFVDAVGSLGGGPVVVVSSKGYTSPVTAVRVGQAIDTQRSRRADMVETYHEVAL